MKEWNGRVEWESGMRGWNRGWNEEVEWKSRIGEWNR
jgi:hypothetical protein